MRVEPITCYRPRPELASEFVAPPYDVFDLEGARSYVRERPRSFLAVDRPETAFPPEHDPCADDVYEKAHELLAARAADGTLLRDGTRCFYLWRQRWAAGERTGIVGAFAVDDYTNGIIRRHELTRAAKEEDQNWIFYSGKKAIYIQNPMLINKIRVERLSMMTGFDSRFLVSIVLINDDCMMTPIENTYSDNFLVSLKNLPSFISYMESQNVDPLDPHAAAVAVHDLSELNLRGKLKNE